MFFCRFNHIAHTLPELVRHGHADNSHQGAQQMVQFDKNTAHLELSIFAPRD